MRLLIVTSLALMLAGCGSVYRSTDVSAGLGGDTAVRVVRLNGETIAQANRARYTPRTLPAIFSMTAGTGPGLRSAGTLPDAPLATEPRPEALELRAPPAVNPGPYRIGIGDVILLSTPTASSTVEELAGLLAAQNARQGYTVQDDGSVNIPNVGRVRIAMMTVDEAEAVLFDRLVENQIDPTFSLEVAEFNSRRVSIGGAVASPTVVPVALTPLFLDEALASAGGITVEDQDFASVRIYREGTLYQIPLTDLYSRSGLRRIRLVDGDAVFVDTAYELSRAAAYFEQQITLAEVRQRARQTALDELTSEVALRRGQLNEARENHRSRIELGADNRDYVFLTGEVGQQARWPLPLERRASLADALFDTAGGIRAETGDPSQIYVLRASDDPREFGAVTAWHLDARNAANLTLMTRFMLRPDDVIFVAEQPVTRWGRTISQITPALITSGVAAATN